MSQRAGIRARDVRPPRRGGDPPRCTPGESAHNLCTTHSTLVGYLLWIFGFLGAHRFYFGKPVTGTIYFFTLGLLGIGWLVDLFLIPGMSRRADRRYTAGRYDYTVAWALLTFLGIFGAHRLYMGKWVTGVLYLCTAGLAGIGVLYDYWTLNGTLSAQNAAS